MKKKYVLLIAGLLILVLYADTMNTSAAVSTFGNTTVGNIVNSFSPGIGSVSSATYVSMEAGRYWLPNTGSVQSITTYFGNFNFQARAAIYTDLNGAPYLLVCVSRSEYITTAGWHTFSVPQTMVASGYYWISVIADNPSAEGRMTPTSTANIHSWKQISSSEEFTYIFGSASGFDSYSPSFYATYTYGTATPTPTPSQSPTATPVPSPSATPTPTPPTPTQTPAPTSAPTPSPRPSGGSSVIQPEDPTPTPTPTRTPTSSPTPPPTPTPTPTPVPTSSPTPNPTSSPTATPSPTPTRSPSPSPLPNVNIGVYTDATCKTSLSKVNWPALKPGASNSRTIYVRNNGDRDVTLELSTTNWNPTVASVYLTLRWNYANQVLKPNQVIALTITIDVAPNMLLNIVAFNYDMVVTSKS